MFVSLRMSHRIGHSLLAMLLLVSCANAHTRATVGNCRPGMVRILVRPGSEAAIVKAFGTLASARDIQRAVLSNGAAIREAISLPEDLDRLTLAPFTPQHSFLFEHVREHINPSLFEHKMSAGPGPDLHDLRIAEDRVSRWFYLGFDTTVSPEKVAKLLNASYTQDIELAEPSYVSYPCYRPNDSLFSQQYAIPRMMVDSAWNIVRCNDSMKVADVDLGVNTILNDLGPAIDTNFGEFGPGGDSAGLSTNGNDDDNDGFIDNWHGWDFVGYFLASGPRNSTSTSQDHGNHTSGIMAAVGDNRLGIAGVAFGAHIIPVKISTYFDSYVLKGDEGIVYSADHGARLINCSWAHPWYSASEQDVIDYATAKGSLVCCAAANNGDFNNYYPASCAHTMSVASTDQVDHLEEYSAKNPRVSLAAPGHDILSTITGLNKDTRDTFAMEDGTSMACPNAAGVGALVLSKFPKLSPMALMERLRMTSDSIAILYEGMSGHGRINALRALIDPPSHALYLEHWKTYSNTADSAIRTGGNGEISVTFHNYLGDIPAVHASISVTDKRSQAINPSENPIILLDSTIVFDAVAANADYTNPVGTIRFKIRDSVLGNSLYYIKLTLSEPSVGYHDIALVPVTIEPDVLDITTSNLRVTFNSSGAMGYDDAPNFTVGNGFQWTMRPTGLQLLSKDLMSQAGIIIADTNGRLADGLGSMQEQSPPFSYMTASRAIREVSPPDRVRAIQELVSEYNDSLPPLASTQLGVNVVQRAYTFDKATDAIAIQYVIRKGGRRDSTKDWSNHIAAGLYADWDVGESGLFNIANRPDATDSNAITFIRAQKQGYPWLAEAVVDYPVGANPNTYCLGTGDAGSSPGGLTNSERYDVVATAKSRTPYSDIATTIGVQNLPLASHDSVWFTVLIAVGKDSLSSLSALKGVRSAWFNEVGTVEATSRAEHSALSISPDPASETIHIAGLDPMSDGSLDIIDPLGRSFKHLDTKHGINNATIDVREFPAGSYIVRLTDGTGVREARFVCIKN